MKKFLLDSETSKLQKVDYKEILAQSLHNKDLE